MNNTIAEFGFNINQDQEGRIAWDSIGSKYNFNVRGKVLGVFQGNEQYFLLSQVASSFGDDCMVGTVDAREVAIVDEENSSNILVSNNEPSMECMAIARMLSGKGTREELNAGKFVEDTKGFEALAKLGIVLVRQDFKFDENVTVCGLEKDKFEVYKKAMISRTK